MTDVPPFLTSEALRADGVIHGFFTREGGVSAGLYRSLNVGSGSRDDRTAVATNRARTMAAFGLPADALVTAYQVHSATAVTVGGPWPDEPPQADGLATDRPGVALGILTADCAPILFADAEARVIGAAHAGWRGALNGVAEATVLTMEKLGAKRTRIRAVVGPCIGPRSYEVGPEFPAPFVALEPKAEQFFRPAPRDRHFLFDLPGYVRSRLAAIGLGAVDVVGADTCADENHFFSYRRSVLRKESDYGRGLSAIALAP
jgi:YfiH family protein